MGSTADRVKVAAAAAMVTVVGLTSACSPTGATPGVPEARPTSATPAPPASLSFSVADSAGPIEPDQPLTVSAEEGQLVSVRLRDDTGAVLKGRVRDGRWTLPPDTRLRPDSRFTWTATARNADGKETTETRTLRTIVPPVTATYRVVPDGSTVGVGMPVMVLFDSPVAPDMRKEVEKRMRISVTPAQRGSWGWVDGTQLMWRPEKYWKTGTRIVVKAPLTGVQTGKGKWIGQDKGATFAISDRARVSRVDLDDHVMTVTENGRRVATYPISAGKKTEAWETRSGTKVITEKHRTYTMDAGTLGVPEDDPDYYKTEVEYAMRVTNTGEFLHSAPWSVGSQGRRNVSHGCVNLGPRDAAEMFRQSEVGDVVEFVDSDRRMTPGDGLSVWLFTPAEWKKLSAL